ncbi:MAG: PH domain-containing protein [Parcubacteria group bacterium]|jgi:uncharacterized membrane protein YdbT with pleckstrin-like domain
MEEKIFGKELLREIEANEGLIKIMHRHWFNIFKQFIPVLLAVFFMAASLVFFPVYFSDFRSGSFLKLFLFVESLFAILVWIYGFFVWIDYYFDIWVITNERIINIEQKGLFVRSLSEVKFEKIQDVTVEVTGFIPTILNYGDVFVQTAAEKERFIFRQIPNPYKTKDLIMNLQKKQAKRQKAF